MSPCQIFPREIFALGPITGGVFVVYLSIDFDNSVRGKYLMAEGEGVPSRGFVFRTGKSYGVQAGALGPRLQPGPG